MSIGNKPTPIVKGELNKPSADPSILKTLSTVDSLNNLWMINQNGIRVKAIIVNAIENNNREVELGSPFLASTAPKSLK